ncbi:IS5 family transposase [Thiolinea disciformis]|uniref:IS5 family transposase n=1 Tax=Thiolinea disciformis TaxID=125614 RepID=UPI0003826E45|nr:IS5 family transposase [Thiolinea disciformis]
MPVQWDKKSSATAEALGRSVGGFSCKIHVLTDGLGYPLRFLLTAGQTADITQAQALVSSTPLKGLLADKGYDSPVLVDYLQERQIEPIIPSRSNALNPRVYDNVRYKEQHLIECFFSKIKHYRRVFARFDKKAQNFMAFLHFVAFLIWSR